MKKMGIIFILISGCLFAEIRIGKPDLVITNIQILSNCKVRIRVRNMGNGGVPESAYASRGSNAAQFSITKVGGGFSVGGRLNTLDPGRVLKDQGRSVSYIYNEASLPPGTHEIEVEIDPTSRVTESNENNNVMRERVTCSSVLPDLIVNRIQILDECKLKITIRNIGEAGVPDRAYGYESGCVGFMVKRDGMTCVSGWLSSLDPDQRLKDPGGYSTWTWKRSIPNGTKNISVEIDYKNRLIEANENNNVTNKRVNCKK